jgi:hypothetical protein
MRVEWGEPPKQGRQPCHVAVAVIATGRTHARTHPPLSVAAQAATFLSKRGAASIQPTRRPGARILAKELIERQLLPRLLMFGGTATPTVAHSEPVTDPPELEQGAASPDGTTGDWSGRVAMAAGQLSM